jgi:hypothetical protein
MNFDEQLALAFSQWSAARNKLAEVRGAMVLGRKGGQLAHSPEAAAMALQIRDQEDVCRELFAELVAVADERTEALERQRLEEARRAFRGDPNG